MNTMNNLTSEIDGLEKLQPKRGVGYGSDRKIDARIEVLRAQVRLCEHQLERLLFPPYWRWGIFSFVYFAISGVILPLLIPLVSSEILLTQLWTVFALYISGFIVMFSSLATEIKNAILKD